MTIEDCIEQIRRRGWRLHSLNSYPGILPSELLWGVTIRMNGFEYGYSINQPDALSALQKAIEDCSKKEIAPPPSPPSWRIPPQRRAAPPTLDSIFEQRNSR